MAEFPRTLNVGRLTARLVLAPPVYAPGGPVAFCEGLPEGCHPDEVEAVESEAGRQGAVLMIIQCRTEETEAEALLRDRGFTFASAWYLNVSLSDVMSEGDSCAAAERTILRNATLTDIPEILKIGESKREQYERFSPVFWKMAPTPREEFAPYITSQVENPDNEALVLERAGALEGFLIAHCRDLSQAYIDDYAVTNPATQWPVVGAPLLTEACRRAFGRGVASIMAVSAYADHPKRAVLENQGFVLKKNWLVRPLLSGESPSQVQSSLNRRS